jgi:hypothetical protein
MTGGKPPASQWGDTMKNAAAAPEIADPYATLEAILKIIGRTWLSEEWRLEDIRLLAQEAVAAQTHDTNSASTRSLQTRLQTKQRARIQDLPCGDERKRC